MKTEDIEICSGVLIQLVSIAIICAHSLELAVALFLLSFGKGIVAQAMDDRKRRALNRMPKQ